MAATLDKIIAVLGPVELVFFVAVWIYTLVQFIRRNKRKAIVGMAIGGASIFLVMELTSVLKMRVRHDLNHFLDEENGPFALQVEGKELSQAGSEQLVSVLRPLRTMPAHHSHTTTVIDIQIADAKGRVVHLALGRDSSVPREYWVYQTDYSAAGDVAHVVTSLLDGYY